MVTRQYAELTSVTRSREVGDGMRGTFRFLWAVLMADILVADSVDSALLTVVAGQSRGGAPGPRSETLTAPAVTPFSGALSST